MRSSLPVLSLALAFCANADAQTPTNLFDIYSGTTNFTSRGIIGTNAGEYLLQVRASHFSGLGHDQSGGGTRLSGFHYVLQDQNGATPETYSLVLRAEAAGVPDCTAAGLLLRVGPFTTAPGGAGAVVFDMNQTLATPSTVLPLCATFYQGIDFAAAPGWTADGLSVHVTDYFLGDNPAPGAPSLSWNCLNGSPQQPAFFETIRVDTLVESAVLQMGNVDPTASNRRSFGAGGLFARCEGPAGLRNDGLACRVRDAANANGIFVLFLGTSLGCPGVPVSGLANGALYLNPTGVFLQLTVGPLSAAGEGIGTAIPTGLSACIRVVNRFVDFQAFTLGPSLTLPGNLTNRASVSFL